MRVLAAMSGGVDSAVAAARAVDAGHDVTGVHLALSRMPGTLRSGSRGCCTVEDALDARRVADRLGIPFYVWDFSPEFTERVVDDFVTEYQAGRTPNPCMRCNERIKFAALMERALDLGFDAVATGHYARVVDTPGGPELHRAGTWAKDQSYVLGVLTADQLRHSLFPLGDVASKAEVRAEAESRGFSVSSKPDSHDICFIPDGDTRGWLEERLGRAEGPIIDSSGELLGSHPGTAGFTVGQRKGLNISRPASDGRPRFVLEVRPADNTVVVGSVDELAVTKISGDVYSWCGSEPEDIRQGIDVHVQIRAHADPVAATARLLSGEIVVTPVEALRAVAPGQTAVLYSGTRVLGQFTIARTVRAGVSGGTSHGARNPQVIGHDGSGLEITNGARS